MGRIQDIINKYGIVDINTYKNYCMEKYGKVEEKELFEEEVFHLYCLCKMARAHHKNFKIGFVPKPKRYCIYKTPENEWVVSYCFLNKTITIDRNEYISTACMSLIHRLITTVDRTVIMDGFISTACMNLIHKPITSDDAYDEFGSLLDEEVSSATLKRFASRHGYGINKDSTNYKYFQIKPNELFYVPKYLTDEQRKEYCKRFIKSDRYPRCIR